MTPGRIAALVVVVMLAALWWGISVLFGASDPPDKDELKLPVASTSAVQALDRGSSRQEVMTPSARAKLKAAER